MILWINRSQLGVSGLVSDMVEPKWWLGVESLKDSLARHPRWHLHARLGWMEYLGWMGFYLHVETWTSSHNGSIMAIQLLTWNLVP